MITMLILFTMMSVAAAICVAYNKAPLANYIWAISNLGFIYHNITLLEYEMLFLFVAYEIIAIFGIYNLRHQKHS